ncbi:hypothetical protein [Sphingobacterium faecium]|uniref:hypothetical protein n=1 Tax=Sphingobacterium faecium TaxID=34087 RepID=UPI00247AE796|nr:hypothetical protein [Sphingobacterium faecium]WGQ16710.1 hypothetical protein QG727_10025 [Sphingobacterium faecium]
MQAQLKFKIITITAMPQIEVEKMLNVLLLRKKKGYSQFELSFLMGQRDYYVRDAEDPNHKLSYAVYFSNIFREIFNCNIQDIVPNINSTSTSYIQISLATNRNSNTIFKAEKKQEDGSMHLIDIFGAEPKDLLLESLSTISEQSVKNWVIGKFANGYFKDAKNALKILKDCEKELESPVRPLFLANALKAFNGTKGTPKLISRKDGNGRFVYGEENNKLTHTC